MHFHQNEFYHIYNRGNNKQQLFFNDDNYVYFLRKIRHFILPRCEILNYTLMPNHFHLLVYINETVSFNDIQPHPLVRGLGSLLSSYAQAINEWRKTSGSLFQQKTKAKCLSDGSANYSLSCFHYIHQNAWKAGLVSRMEDWNYSSFRDYAGLRSGTLCNQELAYKLIDLNCETFYEDSYKAINEIDSISIF